MIKTELELVSNAGIYLYFEEGIRGGVSYICKCYGKVNDKYFKSYHSKQELKHIIYLDTNN